MSIFESLGQNKSNMNDIINQFQQFARNYKGDPRQEVQQLLNSGKITNTQYQQALQKAKALQTLLGIR